MGEATGCQISVIGYMGIINPFLLFKTNLSSYRTIGLPWRRRLKDPLLLLWGQRGIQWNDFDVSDFRAEVIDLTFDPLASLINFLEGEIQYYEFFY